MSVLHRDNIRLAALAKTRRKVDADPPNHAKPATPAWYEWYLLHDQIPGGGWFLQTGLKLAHLPFTHLNKDAASALEKEIKAIKGFRNQNPLKPPRPIRYLKLVDELFQKWRPKIDAMVPDWFIESALKARLLQCKSNRDNRIRRERNRNHVLSELSHSAPVRRLRSRQLDPRRSLPTKRRIEASVSTTHDTDEDVILSEAPSEPDISSLGPGQVRIKNEYDPAFSPQSPAETSTIEVMAEDISGDDMLPNTDERISATPESYTSEEEVLPFKLQLLKAANPTPQQSPPKPRVSSKAKLEPSTTSPSPTSSSHISQSPSPSPSSDLDDPPSTSWSCICGHPNQTREKRSSNYMCMDHERWIPRKQLTVYANRTKTGRKACWTAPKFRACVCGHPDEPEEPCEKNWLCQEHRRWVPRNRLAIVEDWV